jgi:hypothetical protein
MASRRPSSRCAGCWGCGASGRRGGVPGYRQAAQRWCDLTVPRPKLARRRRKKAIITGLIVAAAVIVTIALIVLKVVIESD